MNENQNRTHDPFLRQKECLGEMKHPVIFDVGAYVGDIAAKYASLFPDATIYAFEPFGESYEKLKAKAEQSDFEIRPFRLALGNRTGEADLHVNVYTPTNSLLPSHDDAPSNWGENLLDTRTLEHVPLTTVTDFCKEEGIDRIDILKLDTQGTEYDVLEGAHAMLKEKRIGLIYMEILLVETYVGQRTLAETTDLLAEAGYRLHDIFNPMISKNGKLNQIDAIFLPCGENG